MAPLVYVCSHAGAAELLSGNTVSANHNPLTSGELSRDRKQTTVFPKTRVLSALRDFCGYWIRP